MARKRATECGGMAIKKRKDRGRGRGKSDVHRACTRLVRGGHRLQTDVGKGKL